MKAAPLHTLLLLLLSIISGKIMGAGNPDSLYRVWLNEQLSDSVRAHALEIYFFDHVVYADADSALVLGDQLYRFSLERNNKQTEAVARNLQGCAYFIKGDFQKAGELFEKKLILDRKNRDDVEVAKAVGNLGLVYQNLGDFAKAIRYFREGFDINKRIQDKKGISVAANNIAVLYMDQGIFPRALDYLDICRQIEEETGNHSGLAGTMINIGNIYKQIYENDKALDYYTRGIALCDETNNLSFKSNALSAVADIYRYRLELDTALTLYKRSLDLRLQNGNRKQVANSYGDLSNIYRLKGNLDEATVYMDKRMSIELELNNTRDIAISRIDQGILYRDKREYRKSIETCLQANAAGEKLASVKVQRNACQCLYKSYKKMGRKDIALDYFEKQVVFEDSLQEKETTKKLQRLEFERIMLADSMAQEQEKLEMKNAFQTEVNRKKMSRNIYLASGILLLLVTGGLRNRLQYVRESKAVLAKEKERSDHLLLNILPAEIAEELKAKGSAEARDFDMVSILFTDFVNFTATSEKLSAQELVEEINHCFVAFDRICERNKVEKIKTIGDAYMAAGGLPIQDERAANSTVTAALEMIDFVVARRHKRQSEGLAGFEMRAGIHTGPVVAGIVGIKKFQYDIWGDTVNTANRMESNGNADRVNISHDTYEIVKHNPAFRFTYRGKIEAKGKGEIDMYFVDWADHTAVSGHS